MNRRKFLKQAAKVGASLGVTESFLGQENVATASEGQPGQNAGRTSGKNGRAKFAEGQSALTSLVSLDGEWRLATDPENVGRSKQWFAGPVSEARVTTVPEAIQVVFPGYHGVVWYWRDFDPQSHPHKGGRYLLRFWAVDYLADVWVNGVHVGGHEGGETPFILDITDAVKLNLSNRLAVRVLNPGNEPIDGIVLAETPHQHKRIPFRNGLVYDFGGIMQPVELLTTPAVRVEDLFVQTNWKTGEIRVQLNIRNAFRKTTQGHLQITVAPAATGETLLVSHQQQELKPGDTLIDTQVQVENPHLWDLASPFLYRVTARVQADQMEGADEVSVRCGFRDFRVVNGYFRLNGKRVFLRSSITLNHCPVGFRLPPPQTPDLLRRDMIYSKASGFNTVRFAVGTAYPYQLDLCDEIGLMAYEETYGADSFQDSPKMKERFDRSLAEMIRRDRNHPSITMWELLNETGDGPVFRHAVESLPLVRSLDKTRLVMLSSGRFDSDLGIGSVSNPGGTEWEHVWGKEAPGAGHGPKWTEGGYPSPPGVGSFHSYPGTPLTPEANRMIRTLGQGTKPVFLAEYGIGSLKDVVHEARMYEQVGASPDLEDYKFMQSMAAGLTADWKRLGMDSVYAFPEDMLRECQRQMSRYRRFAFDLIRSNPKLCGYDLTAMLDGAMSGGGVWRFWRDWKPGVMDAMQDGWCPLRWCLFVEPMHSYAGRDFRVEAVLANEDVLRPGEYASKFRICGPAGIAWERQAVARIPQTTPGQDGPLALPVLNAEVKVNGPTGVYELVANMEQGGAPMGRARPFYLSDPASLPRLNQAVTVCGIEEGPDAWLKRHGLTSERMDGSAPARREIILVGDLSRGGGDGSTWRELARRMARGSTVLFLSSAAFEREKDSVGWLPLVKKGRCYKFHDVSIYHKECVAKAHPIFDGLQAKGVMDWDYYGALIPRDVFDGQETPDDLAAAAFAVGHGDAPAGYASGTLLGAYRFGEGRFILNTIPILDNLDTHPAADRLLLNLVNFAADSVGKPLAEAPSNFNAQLQAISYL